MIIQTQLTLNRKYGGPARTVPALCGAIYKMRQDIVLYSSCSDGEGGRADTEAEYIRILDGGGYLSFHRALKNTTGCSLLHDNGLWLGSNYASYRFARDRGIPLVITPHGMLEPWALQHKKIKKRAAWHLYQKRILDHAVVLHATAEAEADNLRALGCKQPIAIIANGIDFPQTLPAEQERPGRTILSISRLHPVKGLENLLRAWSEVGRDGWNLIIAGYDENGYKAELQKLIRTLDLDGSVRIIEALDDAEKWQYYVDADIFVLPTLSENFGIVVAEAMAAATVPITTKGAPWKMLAERDCGWWIEVGVEPLVQALQESMDAGDRVRRDKGQIAQGIAQSEFSWDTIGKKMNRLYNWVLTGGDKPDFVV